MQSIKKSRVVEYIAYLPITFNAKTRITTVYAENRSIPFVLAALVKAFPQSLLLLGFFSFIDLVHA